MERLGDWRLLQTLTIGTFFFSYDQILHVVTSSSVYQQSLHFQGYDAFPMAATSCNGQVMTQKLS